MTWPTTPIMPDRALEREDIWQVDRFRDFTGGENRNLLPEFLKPNQLALAKNCVMTGEGILETRTGKTRVFTTSLGTSAITSVHRFVRESTGKKYLVVQYGTALYSAEYDGTTQIASVASLATGLNASKFRSVVWKDQLILTNGSDNVKTFNGSALSDLAGTPPKSKYVKVYGNRLWLVDVANPNYLRFSDLETPTTWDALNVIHLRDGDGDTITGLSPQDGGMIITKSRSVWVLYGTSRDDFRIPEHPLSDAVGCVAPDTLLDQGFFLGENNMYTFNLTQVGEVSDTHRDIIDSMALSDKRAAFAVYQSNQKKVLVHIGTEILCLDERYQAITSWDTLNAKCFSVLDAAGDDSSVVVGDVATGLVYKLDNTDDDDGGGIPTTIQHFYNDNGLTSEKQWRHFMPELESCGESMGSIDLVYDIDYGLLCGQKNYTGFTDPGLVWGTGEWGTGSWGDVVRMNLRYDLHKTRGNRITFKINTSDRVRYFGYVLKWRPIGDL